MITVRKLALSIIASLTLAISLSPISALANTNYYNQNVTAYVSYPDRRTASGQYPYVGTCAVHPTTYGGITPIFPFNSLVQFTQPVNTSTAETQNSSTQGFIVDDVGDVYFNQGLTQYFVDLWWGTDPQYLNAAIGFGKQTMSYTLIN